jgi:hypothetical protein
MKNLNIYIISSNGSSKKERNQITKRLEEFDP